MAFSDIYRGRRVFVTGHTGFKGSWLCEWLLSLGAEVTGFSLPPPTNPAIFDQLGLASRLNHRLGDIRELDTVRREIDAAEPEFVFHLAAQPLVRASYETPVETYATNVMGTVHVMEALRLRRSSAPVAAVMVTTDKCYENREWLHAYREEDPMGGHDPYSSSKGAAEIAISAYRRSYFSNAGSPVRLASARAGNVVGGGDWALDRIVPDCIRSLQRNEPIPVRNKIATRPWQHVLEPLSGYLALAAAMAASDGADGAWPGRRQLCGGFNFGPGLSSNRTVLALVGEVLRHWPGEWRDFSDPQAVHEAKLLNLSIDKAFHLLHWQPVWEFEETIAQTVAWYRKSGGSADELRALTQNQIVLYTAAAREHGMPWASE